MTQMPMRRVAVLGGMRIPFCRSHTAYAELSNLDMLTAALCGLADRFGLAGAHIDEVVGGAVITHAKDWNLAREAVIGSSLARTTPGITMMQACGTSLQAALGLAAKIATGQIESGIAMGSDTTSDAPIVFQKKFAKRLVKASRAKSLGQRVGAFKGMAPGELAPLPPDTREPRTGLGMGEHCELMAKEWGISRQDQDILAFESHCKAAAAYDEGFMDDLVVPNAGLFRDNNIREDASLERLAELKPVFDKSGGTITAGNSTPLTDGAATVLLASEKWAKSKEIPIQAYLILGRTSAVDYVEGEGLAQVLATLKAWESEAYCRDRLGRNAPLGTIDQAKMNVKGSSIAFGHPFAATGARILSVLAKLLHSGCGQRGLISVCTAGGMGVAAILEGVEAQGTGGSEAKEMGAA
jgi:acetyl-CoA C-acetyltransferase